MKREEEWNMMYSLLEEYKKEHGNAEVPFRYVTKTGKRLGEWVNTQRDNYKNNKLDETREGKLKFLDFRLETIDLDARWNDWYNLLVEYKKEHGNTEVPITYVTSSGEKLGIWVYNQRNNYKNNKLDETREGKLKFLDFRLETIDLDARWNDWYNLLVEYKKEHGNTEVPITYVTSSGEKLGIWVYNQRNNYKNNKLDETREGKLKFLDFRFSDKNDEIKKICLFYEIDYENNKASLKKLTYDDFIARLYYLLDNYKDLVDDNGNLNIIFGMDKDTLSAYTDFTSDELKSYYNKEYMMKLIDSFYKRVENKTPIKIKRR